MDNHHVAAALLRTHQNHTGVIPMCYVSSRFAVLPLLLVEWLKFMHVHRMNVLVHWEISRLRLFFITLELERLRESKALTSASVDLFYVSFMPDNGCIEQEGS